ncbi:MAG: hypothetical protein HY925_16240, partial [Elusimicrobia bacterium]|nr:hypothetical protein [Elusimicrobiota bacterium]
AAAAIVLGAVCGWVEPRSKDRSREWNEPPAGVRWPRKESLRPLAARPAASPAAAPLAVRSFADTPGVRFRWERLSAVARRRRLVPPAAEPEAFSSLLDRLER